MSDSPDVTSTWGAFTPYRHGIDGYWDASEPLLAHKETVTLNVSQELIADAEQMRDLIGKVMRGEIELRPVPPPKPHRCVFCWLLALLPGHERCEHGRIECGDCWEGYG